MRYTFQTARRRLDSLTEDSNPFIFACKSKKARNESKCKNGEAPAYQRLDPRGKTRTYKADPSVNFSRQKHPRLWSYVSISRTIGARPIVFSPLAGNLPEKDSCQTAFTASYLWFEFHTSNSSASDCPPLSSKAVRRG